MASALVDRTCAWSVLTAKFFTRQSGCLDPECPFEHDAQAALVNRNIVLVYRRAESGRMTLEDVVRYCTVGPTAFSPLDAGLLVEKIGRIIRHPDPPVCWDVDCCALEHNPSTVSSLQSRCQKTNWTKQHKPDFCPSELIIETDEL
ncbi:hypothetical protein K488DRAFT_85342 [Vararia minispora EC-137]|uniref:Uncharacterized protein n=1 Tax=Vararia minispora EC-137 TaxID=1314806 RepID=A0ACB8QMT1_9AGAM|nr:hypothetical protein K488DRAFT_85342 [Vararia minispora EC-137]